MRPLPSSPQLIPTMAQFDILKKPPGFILRLKAGEDPGGMVVVKEFAPEFQIQLAAELGDTALDLLRLGSQVFLIVKSNGCHMCTTPLRVFSAGKYIITFLLWEERSRSAAANFAVYGPVY